MADFDKTDQQNLNERQRELQEQIRRKRFYTIDDSGKTDTYIRAWMMLQLVSQQRITQFNRKRILREMQEYMDALDLSGYGEKPEEEQIVYRAEWRAFAKKLLEVCQSDRQYRTTLWGLLPLSRAALREKICSDICRTAKICPAELGLEHEFAVLYELLVEECQTL